MIGRLRRGLCFKELMSQINKELTEVTDPDDMNRQVDEQQMVLHNFNGEKQRDTHMVWIK